MTHRCIIQPRVCQKSRMFQTVSDHSFTVRFQQWVYVCCLVLKQGKINIFLTTQWTRTLLHYNNYLSHHSLPPRLPLPYYPLESMGGWRSLPNVGRKSIYCKCAYLFNMDHSPVITLIGHWCSEYLQGFEDRLENILVGSGPQVWWKSRKKSCDIVPLRLDGDTSVASTWTALDELVLSNPNSSCRASSTTFIPLRI